MSKDGKPTPEPEPSPGHFEALCSPLQYVARYPRDLELVRRD